MEINYRVFHKLSFKKLKLEEKPKKNKNIVHQKLKNKIAIHIANVD